MNESNWGPFKSFSVLWFPFSIPATVLAMVAWLAFLGINWVFSLVFDAADSGVEAVALFGLNVRSAFLGFSLSPVRDGTGWMFFLQCLAAIALWGTLGVGISRCIALRLTRDEYIGVRDAVGFGWQNAATALLYPVIIAGCMLVIVVINAVCGLLMQIPFLGLLFYVFLPLNYVLSGLMLVIGLTGVLGIGMVSGAIAVERRGTLDAWGKALNYIFARPIHFIIYLVVIKVFLVDLIVHYALGERILHRWTASTLTTFLETTDFAAIAGGASDPTGFDWLCARVFGGIGHVVTLFLIGLVLSYAHAAFTGMFLILRRDVDGIDVTDIEVETPEEEPLPERVEAPVETCPTVPQGEASEEPPASPQAGEDEPPTPS